MLGEVFNGSPVVPCYLGSYTKLQGDLYLNYQYTDKYFYIDTWVENELKILIEFKPRNPEIFVTILKQLHERVNHAW